MFSQQLLWLFTLTAGQVVPVFLLASVGAGPMVWAPSRAQISSQADFYRSEITCLQNHSISQQGRGAQHQSRGEADGQGRGKEGG